MSPGGFARKGFIEAMLVPGAVRLEEHLRFGMHGKVRAVPIGLEPPERKTFGALTPAEMKNGQYRSGQGDPDSKALPPACPVGKPTPSDAWEPESQARTFMSAWRGGLACRL